MIINFAVKLAISDGVILFGVDFASLVVQLLKSIR